MVKDIDIYQHNSSGWDANVKNNSVYTIACSKEDIELAKKNILNIKVSDYKYVPREWLPEDLNGLKILALASGGGQQAPIFAAAGADVTIFDNSTLQLSRDKEVAEREHLKINTIKGNMIDLSRFDDGSFDVVFNPMSSFYIPDVTLMYKEASRVLKDNGIFITGFFNPVRFLLDSFELSKGELEIKNPIPFNPLNQLDDKMLHIIKTMNSTLTFGHTLESLIGGQIDAGLIITGFYEDKLSLECISRYINCCLVTCARKGNVYK